MTYNEIHFDLRRIRLAGKLWHPGKKPKIIALHGWLDNANSFDVLAPQLSDFSILAIDMAGHGRSQHRDYPYYIWEYALDILNLVDDIDEPVHLLGHSLGAGVAFLTGSLLQKRCLSLTLLEGLSPYPGEPRAFAEQFRKAAALHKRERVDNLYSTFPELVKQRMASPVAPLDQARAESLASRGSREVEGGYQWTHDPRLILPSLVRLSDEQIFSIAQDIQCPGLQVRADRGMVDEEFSAKLMSQWPKLSQETISGDHHFHMSPNNKKTTLIVNQFLKESVGGPQ